MTKEIFPIRLKEARTKAGLTQREVGEKLGMVDASYQKYELGRSIPGLELASRMADALGVSLDWLAGRD